MDDPFGVPGESGEHTVEYILLDSIEFRPDVACLLDRLRVPAGSRYEEQLSGLAGEAQGVARPKALCRIAYIEAKGDDHVIVDGHTLTSRVLRVNLEKAQRVFAYVATCGVELEEWSRSIGDVLRRYWADTIKEMALRAAVRALNEELEDRFRPGRTSSMSPGSLEDWPLEEQAVLFSILGNPEGAIGVRLSESLVMVPTKSVSGIRFPTEESFESCQLCPREGCPGRRAAYAPGLYQRKYGLRAR